ncbi:MAG: DUF4440 domain-containing protein [Gemmatimonadales bacterium]|nr:DUF4440 domain-containing protein [Gemmatimonadales bacterium]
MTCRPHLAAVAALSMLAATPLFGQTAADSAAVRALREQFVRVYNAGDTTGLDSLYTPTAARMPYDAPTIVGATPIIDALRRGFQQRAFTPALELRATELLMLGEWVLERGVYREILTPRAGGTPLVEEGKYVAVLRRAAAGRWRYHWSIFNRDGPARRIQ